jgi:DNA replication and repair protein RecF
MFLRRLQLQYFRNYNDVELNIDRQVNIFIGNNAQGKTNLLEAIYILATTRSHRTYQEKELIQWNSLETHIKGEIIKKHGKSTLDLNISQKGKKAKINGLEQKKISAYIGFLNVVLFAPEDLDMVKGPPNIRRRFLDMEIGQVYPSYLYDLVQFHKVLIQRNNYLKQMTESKKNDEMLVVWNEQLVQYGVRVIKKRLDFLKKIQVWVNIIHQHLTNQKEKININYVSSLGIRENDDDSVIMKQYMVKLSQVKDFEVKRGITLVGPHRDDILLKINEKEVKQYGSQGQQRTVALSLKLAEIELIHEEIGEYPLLLLDDVLSELDEHRQTQLIHTFQEKVQTFITTTNLNSVQQSELVKAQIFDVVQGKVNRR